MKVYVVFGSCEYENNDFIIIVTQDKQQAETVLKKCKDENKMVGAYFEMSEHELGVEE